MIDLSSSPPRETAESREVPEVADSQLPLPPSVEEPKIAIQISPHSSLDRQQFPQYSSNLGASVTSTTQTEQVDSGLSVSSPASTQLDWVDFNQSGIVPDSQSFEGSASYITTQSKSDSGPSATQFTAEADSTSASNLLASLSVELPNAPSDPIEDSSNPQVATGATLGTDDQVSGPLPTQSLGRNPTILDTEVTGLLTPTQSPSEPAKSLESTSRDSRAYNEYLPESQPLANPSLWLGSSAFEPLTQDRSTLPSAELRDAVLQETTCNPTRDCFDHLQDSDLFDEVENRHSQKQGSYALDSQGSRKELEISPAAGKPS